MQFIAFDIETTGMVPGVDKIVEIGAVRFLNGAAVELFATLVNPQMAIPSAATAVNGISDEMVKEKPAIEKLLEPFAQFCGDDLLVAHNAPFDFQFISSDIKKFESAAPKGAIIDTCAVARKVFPGLPNYKLSTLVQVLKIESQQFHRAEQDAIYCGQLFMKILEKIGSMGSNTQLPIENLVTLSGKKELRFPQIVKQPRQLSLL